MLPYIGGRGLHSLAGVVVTKGEDTNDTCPSSCDLPGKLAGSVLSVGTETKETTESDNSDGVTKNDRVIAVGLGFVGGLLCLLLSLLLQLLSLLLGLLSLLASLGLKTFTLGLSLGLDLLRLEIGGNRRNVRAVDVDELMNVVVSVLNLGNGVCAPWCLLALACCRHVDDQILLL